MNRCTQPGCNRAGDDVGQCGNTVIPCPRPVAVSRTKDVVISCRPCNKTWAVNVPGTLMRGGSLPRCLGGTDNCKAVVVPQEKAPAK